MLGGSTCSLGPLLTVLYRESSSKVLGALIEPLSRVERILGVCGREGMIATMDWVYPILDGVDLRQGEQPEGTDPD